MPVNGHQPRPVSNLRGNGHRARRAAPLGVSASVAWNSDGIGAEAAPSTDTNFPQRETAPLQTPSRDVLPRAADRRASIRPRRTACEICIGHYPALTRPCDTRCFEFAGVSKSFQSSGLEREVRTLLNSDYSTLFVYITISICFRENVIVGGEMAFSRL